MLSDRIISFGEAVKNGERKASDFWGKKSVKLTLSGITAAAFLFLTFYFSVNVWISFAGTYILGGLIFLVMFVGIGEFFANIGKPAFKKYVIADIAAMAVIMPASVVLSLLYNCDLELLYPNFWQTLWSCLPKGLLWFGIPMVLSILFGRLVVHRKKG